MKLAVCGRYLMIIGANFSKNRSTDSEGQIHYCIDLFRPFRFRVIDVELDNKVDFVVLAKIQELTKLDPLIVWTKLEVYSKKNDIPVFIVLRGFLQGELTYDNICRLARKSFRSGNFLYSVD